MGRRPISKTPWAPPQRRNPVEIRSRKVKRSHFYYFWFDLSRFATPGPGRFAARARRRGRGPRVCRTESFEQPVDADFARAGWEDERTSSIQL